MHQSTVEPGMPDEKGMRPSPTAASAAGPAYLRRRRRADSLWLRAGARVGGLLVMLGGVLLGLQHSGQMEETVQALLGDSAARMGLVAEQVEVRGLTYRSPQSVLAALGVDAGGSLVGFSAARARRMLENLDWVKHAEVLRRYPNGLLITIEERKPLARWRVDGQEVLVDREGVAISSLDMRRFAHLPLVEGEGANREAAALVNLLSATPEVLSHLSRAVLVDERRWNLHMRSGLVVLLPERDAGAALQRLAVLQRRHGVLQRALRRLDLRDAHMSGRMVLGLMPQESGPGGG